MIIIENDFTKELSSLLKKYKKTLISDKSGIIIVQCETIEKVLIKRPVSLVESFNDMMFFVHTEK